MRLTSHWPSFLLVMDYTLCVCCPAYDSGTRRPDVDDEGTLTKCDAGGPLCHFARGAHFMRAYALVKVIEVLKWFRLEEVLHHHGDGYWRDG